MYILQEYCRVCVPLLAQYRGLARSQHWRIMEQSEPIVVKHVIGPVPKDTKVSRVLIKDAYSKPLISKEVDHSKIICSTKPFYKYEKLEEGMFAYFTEAEWRKLKFNGIVSHEMYRFLTSSFAVGYLQYRTHMKDLYKVSKSCKKHLITGTLCTGKTMTCYGAILSAMQQKQICVPLMYLDEWFVETPYTDIVKSKVYEDGEMKEKWDFPLFNLLFLKNFLAVNSDLLTDEKVLLRDCRWAAFKYSFVGTPLSEVIEVGINDMSIAKPIIKELFSTLLETKIPLSIVVDNADMLHHIPVTRMRSTRKQHILWSKQHTVQLWRISLWNYVKDLINSLETGNVYLATGSDNSPEAISTINSAFKDLSEVKVSNTPTPMEYEIYLNFMRKHNFLTEDLSEGELNELKFLTGMGYEHTYTMMLRI